MQLATRRVYAGRAVRLDVDTVRFPDGSTGELELIRHPGAAAVVPCLTDPQGSDPTILMIKQYRYAAGGPLWEIPAGTLDSGEAPEACARRELLEETGATAERLEPLSAILTTPGFTNEVIHLFMASGLGRSEEHTSELQSRLHLVCRLLLEKKKTKAAASRRHRRGPNRTRPRRR